jgi:Ni,Fe-hydrogenase maturation factor
MRKPTRKNAAATLALAFILGLGATAMADEAVPATFAEALAKANAENKVLIVDFFTDW